MSYPLDPKTLQILDRVIEVLKDVTAGADYFYSIGGNVIKGIVGYDTLTSFPFDMVYLGPEHSAPEYQPDGLVIKFPTIQVEGYVDATGEEDTITRLIKHLRDVQKAVNEDTKSGAGAGSLGVIAVYARVGIAETDDGMLAGDGRAAFKLSINCCVDGDWGEL
jgi:hypothetical protein